MELVDEYYLDKILATIYAAKFVHPTSILKLKSVEDQIRKEFTDTFNPDANVKLIIDKLEVDGFIIVDRVEGSVMISVDGCKFILNNEGYSHRAKVREEEAKIREENIKKLQLSFILSIIATIISVISLIYIILKGR